jgi:hypothetical protein
MTRPAPQTRCARVTIEAPRVEALPAAKANK